MPFGSDPAKPSKPPKPSWRLPPLNSTPLFRDPERRLWRSQRRKSSSIPEGGADFPAASFLARKCPNLGRDSIACCRKIGEEFSSSVEICRKLFQQGISDRHSLLEFSDWEGISAFRYSKETHSLHHCGRLCADVSVRRQKSLGWHLCRTKLPRNVFSFRSHSGTLALKTADLSNKNLSVK